MQFVVVLEIDEAELADSDMHIDDSIENACRHVNVALDLGTEGTVPTTVRPLSEVIAC